MLDSDRDGTDEAVTSNGFEKIEKSLLESIVKRDTLSVKEVTLFQAADRWATKQCEKQGLEADGQLKRRILGEEIIKSIRFPIMSAKEFADVVLDTNILHSNEIIEEPQDWNSFGGYPLYTERENFRICGNCGREVRQIETWCPFCGCHKSW